MKKYLCAIPLVLLLCLSFACQKQSGIDLALARKAADEANQKFIDASLRGDSAAVRAFLAEDTLLLPPGGRIIKGIDATEAYWRATWNQLKISDFKMTTLSFDGEGGLAYEVGNYILKFQLQGKEVVDAGKYVVVWKMASDKNWKKLIDIWNSDVPTQ